MKALKQVLLLICGYFASAHAEVLPNGLYAKAFGDASHPALVFVHGGPGDDSSMFEVKAAPDLAALGYYVIVYDERGQGRSSYADGQKAYAYKNYADDLKSLLSFYKVKSAVLLAHSHGGAVALHFDFYYPELTSKVVLIDAPIDLWQAFLDMRANCLPRYTAVQDQKGLNQMNMALAQVQIASEDLSKADLKETNDNIDKIFKDAGSCGGANGLYAAKGISPDAIPTYVAWQKFYGESVAPSLMKAPKDADPVLGFLENEDYVRGNLTAPILKNPGKYFGIYGDEDGLFVPATLAKIKTQLGGDQKFYLIHGASHNVFVDQEAAFTEALLKVLNK